MKPLKDIQKLIKQFNIEPRSEMRSKVLDEASELQRCRKQQNIPDTYTRRTIMKSRMTKFAAAAVIIIAAVIGINVFTGTPAYAIEQTAEALKSVQSLRMTITNNSQPMELLMWINPQTGLADHIRMDMPNSGDVTIVVPGQSYIYRKQKGEITLLDQEVHTNDLNFKDPINSLIEETNALGGQLIITKSFSELAQQEMIVVTIIRQDESLAGEFLIDPDSTLPIYMGIATEDEQLNYMGPIEYNVDVPEDAFEFTIFEDAKVIDNRPEERKAG